MGLKGIVLGRQSKPLPDFTDSPIRGAATTAGTTAVLVNTGGSISSGYRELWKNTTLAGRSAARGLTGEPDLNMQASRLRMVSRLRKKERFMIWRSVWTDLVRYFMTGLTRLSYGSLFWHDDLATNAVRFRNR